MSVAPDTTTPATTPTIPSRDVVDPSESTGGRTMDRARAASSGGRAGTRLVFVPRPCRAEALTARFDHLRIPRCHEGERRTTMRKTALWSAALLASTLTFVPTAPCFARSLQKDVDQGA